MKKTKLLLLPLLIFLFSHTLLYSQVIKTVAGTGFNGFAGDGGLATNARFSNPISVAADPTGNLFVADYYNHRIRKINQGTGIITTIAGTGTAGFSGDGGLAINAQINNPNDVCVDAAGNVYFVDSQNFRVRKINTTTGIITTVAGNGFADYSGGSVIATNAGIYYPGGIAVNDHFLYLSLTARAYVCIIDLNTNLMYTIAGTGQAGYSGDGSFASSAQLNFPSGVAATSTGVYIADYNNNRIRKIDANGIITTVAGNGVAAFAGDNGLATAASINLPTGVHCDPAGNLFIADRNNNRIRKVDATTGIITTAAGSGTKGYGGDGGSATSPCVKLADPHKVRMDAAGNLYISDQSNSRIRKVDQTPVTSVNPGIQITTTTTTVCANTTVNFSAAVNNAGASPVYQWKINNNITGTNQATFSSNTLNNGDIISCDLRITGACGEPIIISSNNISISVTPATTPAISVALTSSDVCAGDAQTFTAQISNGGPTPVYQWQINGTNAGANNPTFSSTALRNGDIIRCLLTSNANCAAPVTLTSNSITVKVQTIVTPAVNISTNNASVCKNGTASFVAVAINAGNAPAYQWQINGVNAGSNNAVFASNTLANGDVITCNLTSDAVLQCVTGSFATSNAIRITVLDQASPTVQITTNAAAICEGTNAVFTTTVQNAGVNNFYQWKLNDVNTGSNNPVFTISSLKNSDRINCAFTAGGNGCPDSTVFSNEIIMTVKDTPVLAILPANPVINAGTAVTFTASASKTLSDIQWQPAGLLIDANNLVTGTQPLTDETTFSLFVTDTETCTAKAQVTVKPYSKLLMPSAFTPNNDGINDIYCIPPNTAFTLNSFSVYDRWGTMIFFTTDKTKGWDGNIKGVLAAQGLYIYHVKGSTDNQPVFLKGTITLIR